VVGLSKPFHPWAPLPLLLECKSSEYTPPPRLRPLCHNIIARTKPPPPSSPLTAGPRAAALCALFPMLRSAADTPRVLLPTGKRSPSLCPDPPPAMAAHWCFDSTLSRSAPPWPLPTDQPCGIVCVCVCRRAE
jgi:hypothetical protein